LRRHDVIAMAERRRRNLVTTSGFEGCRCCYDPNSDGGEYLTLIEYKKQHPISIPNASTFMEQIENETKEATGTLEEEYDDDSDDEFDYLLDEDLPGGGGDDDTLRELEENRRAELEYQILMNQVALQHGYGTHRQLHPGRVLKAAGLGDTRQAPPAVVLHLVDADSLASASLDYFLETDIAPRHKGTMFVRSGGRSTLLMDAVLAQKAFRQLKPDRDMPCLVAIKDGVVIHTCPNLSGLCQQEDGPVEPRAVEEWLDNCGVLLDQAPRWEALCYIRPEEEALMDYLTKPKAAEFEYYDCGLEGCQKTFSHEHVGIKTSEQDGLVVKEDTVLGNDSEE
jgi:hypothetical protein